MALSDDDVRYVARLARLKISGEEIPAIRSTLNRVLEYVGQLSALDTDGVVPTMHVVPVQSPLRPDVVHASLPVAEATKNGPEVQDGMFVVPRIMDVEGGDPA